MDSRVCVHRQSCDNDDELRTVEVILQRSRIICFNPTTQSHELYLLS